MSEDTPARDSIWESGIDNGAWRAEVTGTDDTSVGLLRIYHGETGEQRFEQPVTLAYGAMFGPDMDDVYQWQETVLSWIDNQ